MKMTYDFLKDCGTYYIATNDNGQPRVRPFGTVNIFENKLYIQTGKKKEVSKQMHQNPKIEICAFKDGRWIRVTATAVLDERLEPQESLLSQYTSLQKMYKAGDGNNEVWYLKDAVSIISSFTEAAIREVF